MPLFDTLLKIMELLYCNLKVNINLVACEAARNTGERTSQPQLRAP